MSLSVDQIFSANGTKTKAVDMSPFGWGGEVLVGKMSVSGRDRFAKTSTEKDSVKTTAVMLEVAMVEPRLTPELASKMAEQCDADAIDALAKEIMAFNGLTQEAVADAKKSFPAESGSEVPVSAGAEAAQDR